VSNAENQGKNRALHSYYGNELHSGRMCNTYATRVARTTVDEFCPGFSAFGIPFRSIYIAVRPNTAFLYILFCGILVAMSINSCIFFHPRSR
jgi:hypothetical protein